MTQSMNVASLDHSVEKTNRWLKELMGELNVDRDTAYDVLRGYLHTIRDCLEPNEASDLAAQLPIIIRGVYYTGWSPSATPSRPNREEFVDMFRQRASVDPDAVDVTVAIKTATQELRRHITAGEMEDVYAQLPNGVREVVEAV